MAEAAEFESQELTGTGPFLFWALGQAPETEIPCQGGIKRKGLQKKKMNEEVNAGKPEQLCGMLTEG